MASLKQQAKAIRKREQKIQALAVAKTPEARKERAKMLENRLWQDRQQPNLSKGHGLTVNEHGPKNLTAKGKGKGSYTYKDAQATAAWRQ